MHSKQFQKFSLVADAFGMLIDKIFEFIQDTCDKIEKDLDKRSKTKPRDYDKNAEQQDLITNQLVLNVIKLVSIMVRFDIINSVDK